MSKNKINREILTQVEENSTWGQHLFTLEYVSVTDYFLNIIAVNPLNRQVCPQVRTTTFILLSAASACQTDSHVECWVTVDLRVQIKVRNGEKSCFVTIMKLRRAVRGLLRINVWLSESLMLSFAKTNVRNCCQGRSSRRHKGRSASDLPWSERTGSTKK